MKHTCQAVLPRFTHSVAARRGMVGVTGGQLVKSWMAGGPSPTVSKKSSDHSFLDGWPGQIKCGSGPDGGDLADRFDGREDVLLRIEGADREAHRAARCGAAVPS